MGKVRLNIKNKNAKTIEVNGKEYKLPMISLYHRKYFDASGLNEEESSVHDMVLPAMKGILKLEDTTTTEEYEYLAIRLLEHNGLLNKFTYINDEKFDLKDLKMCSTTDFIYEGVEYHFHKPTIKDTYMDYLDGMNNLQMLTDYNFYDMEGMFYVFGVRLFRTVSVTGELGNTIHGLSSIIDEFFNENEFIKLSR